MSVIREGVQVEKEVEESKCSKEVRVEKKFE